MEGKTRDAGILIGIKVLHTAVWALMVACIFGIPVAAMARRFHVAVILIGIVLMECLVLALNRGRCPCTNLAERFTEERTSNFDIYLPEWLARNNKSIFGGLFVGGIVLVAICRVCSSR